MVRIKVKLSFGAGSVKTAAIVNTGYGTEEPEILIPVAVAKKLGIWPEFPAGTRVEEYSTAGGTTRIYCVGKRGVVSVVTPERSESVEVRVGISEHEDEVLISDSLASELGIVIEDPKKGLWRFRDEPTAKLRRSVAPKIW
ncbi:hypothetical protein DRP53_00725 [candidate division WOR-3 bacterium]|uniref:Clan AA aspartic protease n=1 Tax=candidate division WOR-3 bacterium TaxID=2052148 RepID=A0A660SLH7_UNCW3|nr:MAG: hypothetical protein DRP53_00725 [candidate division WOR-3 bacterium]